MLKWLSILFVMFAIYGLVYIMFGETMKDYYGLEVRQLDYIKKIASSLLPVYPFYFFALKRQLNRKTIFFWSPFFIVLSAYLFSQFYNLLLVNAINAGSSAKEFTNNMGYVFVSLLPLLFIKQKNIFIQYIYIGICALFIVAGVKRGAILIGAIVIAYYLMSTIRSTQGNKKYYIIFITLIAVIIAGYYIADFITNSNYFAYRVKNTLAGNTSGRDVIYEKIWNTFLDSNPLQLLVGHGADSSIYYSKMLAHNDWLEIIINQGLLGVILMICYFIALYRTWRKYKKNQVIGVCIGSLFIVLFLRTFFSMSFTEYTLFTCMSFGYCSAYISKLNNKKDSNACRA